jgi:hypothetical protein
MSSNTLTFDQTPPRRPTLADVGGGAKVNTSSRAPDPVRQATAEDFNQLSQQAAAAGRVMAVALLSVRISGGNHQLNKQSCAPSTTTLASFALIDHGVGDIEITWSNALFPPAQASPRAYVTGATPAIIAAEATTNTTPNTYGVRVRTQNAAGAPVDVPFDVDVY